MVSPYYIVAYGGRYYLLACGEGRDHVSFWRIELMTKIKIAGEGKTPVRREDIVVENIW